MVKMVHSRFKAVLCCIISFTAVAYCEFSYTSDEYCYVFKETEKMRKSNHKAACEETVGGKLVWPMDKHEFGLIQDILSVNNVPVRVMEFWTDIKPINTLSFKWQNGQNVENNFWFEQLGDYNAEGHVIITNNFNNEDKFEFEELDGGWYSRGAVCKNPCENNSLSPVISASLYTLQPGESLQLTCDPYFDGTTYYWVKDDVILPTTTFEVTTFTDIPSASPALVMYKCMRLQDAGQYLISGNISVVVLATPIITVVSPREETSYSTGTPMTIQCTTPQVDPATASFTWYMDYVDDGTPDLLPSETQHTMQVSSDDLTQLDAFYYCEYNVPGIGTSLIGKRQITFYEGPAMPTVTSNKPESNDAGTVVTLTCVTPLPPESSEFAWYVDGVKVDGEITNTYVSPGEDAGISLYSCDVTDVNMTVTSTRSLDFKHIFRLPNLYNYESDTGGYCYTIKLSSVLYQDAVDLCEAHGTTNSLLGPYCQAEFDNLASFLNEAQVNLATYWIDVNGDYTWKDGSPINSSSWMDNHVNTASGCISLSNEWGDNSRFGLDEVFGCLELVGSICKKPCLWPSLNITRALGNRLEPWETATVDCVVPSDTVEVVFYEGGVETARGTSATLNVPAPNTYALKQYTCTALKSNGEYGVSAIGLDLLYFEIPSVTSSPHGLNSYSTGTPVTLTCNTVGDITGATYTWYRIDNSSTTIELSETSSTFTIDSTVLPNLENEWACEYTISGVGTSLQALMTVDFFEAPGMPTVLTDSPTLLEARTPVVLTCDVTNSDIQGPPAFVWYRNGVEVTGETTATLNVYEDLPGTVLYACAVSDSRATLSTQSVDLTHIFKLPPHYAFDNGDYCYTVIEGPVGYSDASTLCPSEREDAFLTTLYSEGERSFLTGLMVTLQSLNYSYWVDLNGGATYGNGLTIPDAAWYPSKPNPSNCPTISNEWGDNSEFTLIEQTTCNEGYGYICKLPCIRPTLTITRTLGNRLEPWETATVDCGVPGDTAEVTFYENRIEIARGSSSTLNLPAPNTYARKTYTCTALQPNGQFGVSALGLELLYLETPFITSFPHGLNSYSTGTPVTLTCDTTGDISGATYTWHRIDNNGTTFALAETGSSLTIDSAVLPNLENQWACEYTIADVGTSLQTVMRVDFFEGPGMPTVLTDSPTILEARIPVILSCDVTNSDVQGPAVFVWYKNGAELTGETAATLNVYEDVPGTMLYSCAVSDNRTTLSTRSVDLNHIFKLPPHYIFDNGDYCYTVIEGPVTYSNVSTLCLSERDDAFLATLYSEGERSFLTSLMANLQALNYSYWMNLNGGASYGNGMTIPDAAWYPSKPNPSNCPTISNAFGDNSAFALIEQTTCDEEAGFICKLPCLSTSLALTSSLGERLDPWEETTVSCSAPADAEVVTFLEDNVQVLQGASTSMTMAAPNTYTQKVITCTSLRPDGQLGVSANNLTLRYIEHPTLVSDPHDATSYSLETAVTLICQLTTSVPDAVYTWYTVVDGVTEEIPNETNSTLVLNTAVATNGSIDYVCEYSVPVVGASPQAVKPMEIYDAPRMPLISTDSPTHIESRTFVTLTCTPTSDLQGSPTYAWYENGALVAGETAGTLTTTYDITGTVTYYCTVQDDRPRPSTRSDDLSHTYTFPSYYDFNDGKYCYHIEEGPASRDVAEQQCLQKGGHTKILTPYSREEINFVIDLMTNLQNNIYNYWIKPEGNAYKWTSGDMITTWKVGFSHKFRYCIFLTNNWGLGLQFALDEHYYCTNNLGFLCKYPCTWNNVVVESPDGLYFDPSESVTVKCKKPGGTEVVTFYEGDVEIASGPSEFLTLPPPLSVSRKDLTCSAVKFDGSFGMSHTVTAIYYFDVPFIESEPHNDMTYSEGTPVDLLCRVPTHIEHAVYNWYKANNDTGNMEQLVGENAVSLRISSDEIGLALTEYACEYHVDGIGTSLQATREVQYYDALTMPTITSDNDILTFARNTVTLTCNLNSVAVGAVTYAWYVNDVEVPGETASTFVTSVDYPQNVTYGCIATDSRGLPSTRSLDFVHAYLLPPLYEYDDGDYCYIINKGPLAKDSAISHCKSLPNRKGTLLKPYSRTEFFFLQSLMNGLQSQAASYWIDLTEDGDWFRYENGILSSTSPVSQWIPGADNGAPGCVVLTNEWGNGTDFAFEKRNCTEETGFICKVPCLWPSISLTADSPSVVEPWDAVTLHCNQPDTEIYKFFENGTEVAHSPNTTYSLPAPNINTRISYTCAAIKSAGQYGVAETIFNLTYFETPLVTYYPVDNHDLHVYSFGTVVTLFCHLTLPATQPPYKWVTVDAEGEMEFVGHTGSNFTFDNSGLRRPANTFKCTYTLPHLGESPPGMYDLTYIPGPARPEVVAIGPTTLLAQEHTQLECVGVTTGIGVSAKWYVNDVLDPDGTEVFYDATNYWPTTNRFSCKLVDSQGTSTISAEIPVEFTLPETYSFYASPYYCYTLVDRSVNREDAVDECHALGADASLLVLHTQQEFNNLANQMAVFFQQTTVEYWVDQQIFPNSIQTVYQWKDESHINNTYFTSSWRNPISTCLLITNSQGNSNWKFKEVNYGCDDLKPFICRVMCNDDESGTPPVVSLTEPRPFIRVGTTAEVSCTPTFDVSFIKWFADGEEITTTTTTVHTFPSKTETSNGTFACAAYGVDGQMIMSDDLNVVYMERPFIYVNPVDSIRVYSSGTPIVLECRTKATLYNAKYSWFVNGTMIPVDTYEYTPYYWYIPHNVTDTYRCRYEIAEGPSDLAFSELLEIFPGPGMPTVEQMNNYWVHVTVPTIHKCVPSSRLEPPVSYQWFYDGELMPDKTGQFLVNTTFTPSHVNYSCKVMDATGLSSPSLASEMIYAVANMCNPARCQNYGRCRARNYLEDECVCDPGFESRFCETVIVMRIAKTFDFNQEAAGLGAVEEIHSGITNDLMRNLTNNTVDRIAISADVLTVYSHRLIDKDKWNTSSMTTVTDKTVGKTQELMGILRDEVNCTEGEEQVGLCRSDNKETVFRNLEDSMFSMGTAAINTKSGSVFHEVIHNGNITVTVAKSHIDNSQTFAAEGANITLPYSLKQQSDVLQVVGVKYNENPYYHSTTNFTPVGEVFTFKVNQRDGSNVTLDPQDEVVVDMDDTSEGVNHTFQNYTKIGMHVVPVSDYSDAVVVVELTVMASQVLDLMGSFLMRPFENNLDFHINVRGMDGQLEVYNNTQFEFIYDASTEILKVVYPMPDAETLFLSYDYNDTMSDSEFIEASVGVYAIYVNFWDSETVSWTEGRGLSQLSATQSPSNRRRLLGFDMGNKTIKLLGLGPDGKVKFSSNFFGSFSLSKFVIVPNLINFNIFKDFWALLEDSPGVLVVNMVILFISIFVILKLRRSDRRDRLMWTYMPLVDNEDDNPWLYTISVHTSLDSSKELTAMPYFTIQGIWGTTYVRVLSDGVRQNFCSGSLSNFVLRSPVWLGDLRLVKIWTDGLGQSPEWKLDRIIITDVSENKRYLFICQEWLALTKGDGEICRTIPALQPDNVSGASSFSLISKQKLYNDHLWLSVAKRPTYSTFTRVQRFLCALSLLYLSMISNAMFYNTGGEQQDTDSGVKLGFIQVGYREVYVGFVSAFLILVPGFLMTYLFTHRKLKGVNYAPRKNKVHAQKAPPVNSPSLGAMKSPNDPMGIFSSKSSTELFKEEESASDSINFLKQFFKDFKRNTPRTPRNVNFTMEEAPDEAYSSEPDETSFSEPAPNEPSYEGISQVIQDADSPRLLPWWTVYIGYAVVVLSILPSASFCFFYSLEWGGATSLQWLLSLVISTSASSVLIEPIKIMLLCLVLSCIFRQFAVSEISVIAPFDKSAPIAVPEDVKVPRIVQEPNVNTKEMKKRKEDMKLREKFMNVLRGLGFQVMMVILIGIVCLHSEVTLSYRQNKLMQDLMDGDYVESNVRKPSDIYAWVYHVLDRAMPTTHWNNQPLTSYEKKYTNDRQYYRMGPIRLMQYRGIEGNDESCEGREQLPHYFHEIRCSRSYDLEDRERRDFYIGWILCNGSASIPCDQKEFHYFADDKSSLSQSGDLAWYGPGGYQTLLLNSMEYNTVLLNALNGSGWLDHLTRAVMLEMTVYNPNTNLFTQARALVEMPNFGRHVTTVTAKSARLYNYITVWDYLVLLFQLIFAVVAIIRLTVTMSLIIKPPKGASRCSWSILLVLIEIGLTLSAFILYIVRVAQTVTLLEDVMNKPTEFSSFDLVFLLDEFYILLMSIVFFIRILMCLMPLTLNYHLFLMRETLRRSVPQLRGFGIIILVSLIAFSFFFSLSRGSSTKRLRSVEHTFSTLLTLLLGLSKYRGVGGETEAAEMTGKGEELFRLMYCLFCFGSTIILVNLAIVILGCYMNEAKFSRESQGGKSPGYDEKLSNFMWNQINNMIERVLTASGAGGLYGKGKKKIDLREQYLKSEDADVNLDKKDEFYLKGHFFHVK